MYHSYATATAHDALIRAALRAIATDHYDVASTHADAESEYASEKLALAARALVRAVDALPEADQPIGWGVAEDATPAPSPLGDVLDLLACLVDRDACWFDHHGGCQAHGFLSLEPGEKCPHAEAKELLARHGKDGA